LEKKTKVILCVVVSENNKASSKKEFLNCLKNQTIQGYSPVSQFFLGKKKLNTKFDFEISRPLERLKTKIDR